MGLNLRDLVARLRIVTDKKAATDAEKEVTGAFGKMEAMAKRVGLAIAAAFAVQKIIAFAKSSIAAAVESEVPWNRLANTLSNVGVKFSDVERRVRLAARAMMDASTMGDEQFAETLDRLVSLSGDFEASLKNVQLVADVAAKFFNGELAPAANLVGKAMAGNTRALIALGIRGKDAADGLRILAERSRGAAANELNTLQGKLKQVGEAWGEFKEATGNALIKLIGFTTGANNNVIALNRVKLGLQEITETLERGQMWKKLAATGLFGKTIAMHAQASLMEDDAEQRRADLLEMLFRRPAGKPKGPVLSDEDQAKAAADREAALDKEVSQLVKAHELNLLNANQIVRALDLEERYLKLLRDGNLTLDQRVRIQGRVNDLKGSFGDNTPADPFKFRGATLAKMPGIIGGPRSVSALGVTPGLSPEEIQAQTDAMKESLADVTAAGINAAFGISGAFQDAFGLLLEDFDNLGKAAEAFGRGVTGALLGGISQWASTKVAEHVAGAIGAAAYALGFTAVGNFPSMGAAWASAGQHTAAALAYGALAGGAGAGQSAVAGGGRGGRSGGVPSGASDGIGRTLENNGRGPQTIIYVDGFNPNNPVHVRTLAAGIKKAGDSDSGLEVRPRGPR